MILLKELIRGLPEINEKWRIHDSGRGPQTKIKKIMRGKLQDINDKPDGFWYGFGTSWLEWCQSEMPKWIGGKLYLVEPGTKNILSITTEEELLHFTVEYGQNIYSGLRVKGSGQENLYLTVETVAKAKRMKFNINDANPINVAINWKDVAKDYDGIEINPMQYKLVVGGLSWYYGWNVASGCIWRPRKTKIKLVGERLKLYKKYEKLLK